MKKRKEEPSLFVWRITALLSALLFLALCWILADSLFSFTGNREDTAVTVAFCDTPWQGFVCEGSGPSWEGESHLAVKAAADLARSGAAFASA